VTAARHNGCVARGRRSPHVRRPHPHSRAGLAQRFGWRSIFFVVVPFCLAALVLARRYLPIAAPGGGAVDREGATRGLTPELISQGASTINSMRRLGGAVGISLVGIVLEWRLQMRPGRAGACLPSDLRADRLRHRLRGRGGAAHGRAARPGRGCLESMRSRATRIP
jgi:hypothetical protein